MPLSLKLPIALDSLASQMHDSCLDLKAGLCHCTLIKRQSQCSPCESQWAPTVQGARSSTEATVNHAPLRYIAWKSWLKASEFSPPGLDLIPSHSMF